MKIDLHMHSMFSDGELSPDELVDWATEKGMTGIAITDHEVIGGSKRALEYARDLDLEVVPGVEIGADDEDIGIHNVHIVGLFLDLENEKLLKLLKKLNDARIFQWNEIVRKLKGTEHEVTFDELKEKINGVNFGIVHIVRVLMRKYKIDDFQEAFDKILSKGCVAYTEQKKGLMGDAIDVIHGAGGIAVLAHPMLYDDFEKIIQRFAELGGDGIEADYPYVGKGFDEVEVLEMIEKIRGIAKEGGLVVSGGGDFHNRSESQDIGDYGVDSFEFLEMKKVIGLAV